MKILEDLIAWQKARQFRQAISILSKSFPKEEKYLLFSQIIRSSRSISANIAEGYGRFHHQENIQYCRQARGSLTETLDHLYVALDEGYINEESFALHAKQASELEQILNGYISFLKKQKNLD